MEFDDSQEGIIDKNTNRHKVEKEIFREGPSHEYLPI